MKFKEFHDELDKHLTESILKYWAENAFDYEKERLYGIVIEDGGKIITTRFAKTSILCSRILWTFSTAYMRYKKDEYKKCAYICYKNLTEDFYDDKNVGVKWYNAYGEEVNLNGIDSNNKHLYSESFAIYGLCAFYKAFNEEGALKKALDIYNKIIEKCSDKINGGFFENMDCKWNKIPTYALAPKDIDSEKTMNTTLHFMEALTPLYEITKSEDVKNTLIEILDIIFDKIVAARKDELDMFFTADYKSVIYALSPGHDIETSWLICLCADTLGEEKYIKKARDLAVRIGARVNEIGFDKDIYTIKTAIGEDYITNNSWKRFARDWWALAEGIIGYFNLFNITGDYRHYKTCLKIWQCAKDNIIDEKYGEWKSSYIIDKNFEEEVMKKYPDHHRRKVKVSSWKCCYHSSRMCFEILKRLENQ